MCKYTRGAGRVKSDDIGIAEKNLVSLTVEVYLSYGEGNRMIADKCEYDGE